MRVVKKTPQAEKDLLEIWIYIARDDATAADRVFDRIESACRNIAERPFMGRERRELAERLFRFPVGNYVISYRPLKGGMELVRVLHGARDPWRRF